MGATDFINRVTGSTAQEAFTTITEMARHEHGHGGYTGTIAEKSDFTLIDPKADGQNTEDWSQHDYEEYANKLTEDDDPRVEDKWGPAGCIEIGDGEYLFFGWASD